MSTEDSNVAISENKLPLVTYILYIAGVVLPILSLAGVIVAYVSRGEAPDWQKTHYTYLIRTFWIGLLFGFVSTVLLFVGIGVLLLIATAIWYLVRTIKGVLTYNKGQPVANPETWLV
ncbi:DUF4870 domain-containing protein [Poseidonocella sp. HB161398]|uniref:DUF4870 family protein n=1 Tax=Poseidonocella sp. HB161398 TaxID=2320855 RepID=UPI00110887DA|nr:DUF4870 domain-containing protein [Poseidonocella sp. HB161398]